MRKRRLVVMGALGVAVGVTSLGSVQLAAQSAATPYSAPRTSDGRADFSGMWNYSTLTPMERPRDLGGKATFTEEEAGEFVKKTVNSLNADANRDTGTRNTVNGTAETQDVALAYNDFWWDRGNKIVGSRRTSMVIDPADGRIPALLPEAKQADADRRGRVARLAVGPEDRPTGDRCILQQRTGPPMVPGGYNNNLQWVQTPEYIAIYTEQIHDVRIIPMDGRPHVNSVIGQWKGDSRGHWEGDTLVVETTNYNGKMAFQGTGTGLKLTERFTRTAADVVDYQFTIEDPASFGRPWTAGLTMTAFEGPIYEYACHEGNYAMEGILRAARKIEAGDAAIKGSN